MAALPSVGAGTSSSVLVLTFATEETAYLPALRESASKQGFRFEVLGLGQKWQGFIWANSLLQDRMKKCDPDELVLMLDGYDTLITMPCEEMVRKYNNICLEATGRAGRQPPSPLGRWVIFGIEHPKASASGPYWNTMVRMARRYHFVPPDCEVYMNTGAALGPAKHMLTYLDETVRHGRATGNKDDQNTANALYWGWWVHPDVPTVTRPDAPLPIALDTQCELFYCHCERRLAFLLYGLARSPNNFKTSLERTLMLRDGGVFRKASGCKVGVVHGIWNTNMNAICEYLGYPYEADYHKEVSQPDIRIFARVTRFLLVWPCGPLWLLFLLAYASGIFALL